MFAAHFGVEALYCVLLSDCIVFYGEWDMRLGLPDFASDFELFNFRQRSFQPHLMTKACAINLKLGMSCVSETFLLGRGNHPLEI